MVRQFSLINKSGQIFNLTDINKGCLLTNPLGLGVDYSNDYAQIGNSFFVSNKKISQSQITGTCNFINYDKFKEFIDFVSAAQELKLAYTIPYDTGSQTFYKDVEFKSITKSEKDRDSILKETITLDSLSLWYAANETVYELVDDSALIWDFNWNPTFTSFADRNADFVNVGHAESTILLEVTGPITNLTISLYIDNVLTQEVPITVTLLEGEKLEYSSREGKTYIKKISTNNIETDLYNLDNIDFSNDNAIRIPAVNKSARVRITSEVDIVSAKLIIYTYYVTI